MNKDTEKFCRDCKYLLGIRNNIDTAHDRWKCNAPQNIATSFPDLVTGEIVITRRYETIYDLRNFDHSCSKVGNWFELYVKPSYHPVSEDNNFGDQAFSLDDAEKNRMAAQERLAAIRNRKSNKTKLSSNDLDNL